MSVREEDRQRNCPSRGLGIAAAAIGVGVGAALYYFFNKRSENPDAEGSTSNWACEEPQALRDSFEMEDSNSSIDVSTSPNTSFDEITNCDVTNSDGETETDSETESDDIANTTDTSNNTDLTSDEGNSYMTISEHSTSDTSINTSLDSDIQRYDISNLSDLNSSIEHIGTPDRPDTSMSPPRGLYQYISMISVLCSTPRRNRRTTEDIQRLAKIREQAFRERSWTLEECSICFEPMQRTQEVMALPCTHRFHQPCILPWLQERQTCPNCRKEA